MIFISDAKINKFIENTSFKVMMKTSIKLRDQIYETGSLSKASARNLHPTLKNQNKTITDHWFF